MDIEPLDRETIALLRGATRTIARMHHRSYASSSHEIETETATPLPGVTVHRVATVSLDGAVHDHQPEDSSMASVGFVVLDHNKTWRTLVDHLLSPGDRLELRWTASNNSPNLDRVGFHCDSLAAVVLRGTASHGVSATMHFGLGEQVCPDNTARMIRRVHPSLLTPRAPSADDVEDRLESLAVVVAGARGRRKRMCAYLHPTLAAQALGWADDRLSGVELVADPHRYADELVLTDTHTTRVLTQHYLPPADLVTDARAYQLLRPHTPPDQAAQAVRAASM